jgi:opacity protein-like surface antigen
MALATGSTDAPPPFFPSASFDVELFGLDELSGALAWQTTLDTSLSSADLHHAAASPTGVRGRLGYSFGRLMAYGTAGYAYGGLEVQNVTTGAKSSEGLSGWTYGGGLEYFWNRDLNLHVGYRRIDFDDQTFAVLPGPSNTLSPEMDIIDFGLTTRF